MDLLIPSLCGNSASSMESDYFVEATKYLYGLNIIGANATEADKQKANQMWNAFLQQEGKTLAQCNEEIGAAVLPANRTSAQQAALKTYTGNYNTFLLEQLQQVAFTEKSILTIQGTEILWSIFDIMILLMQKTNTTQLLDSQAVKFLTDYQTAYQSKVIDRAFMFVGTDAQTEDTPNLQDPLIDHPTGENLSLDTYRLGYANITMGEVVRYLLQDAKFPPAIKTAPINTTVFQSPLTKYSNNLQLRSSFSFTVTYHPENDTYTILSQYRYVSISPAQDLGHTNTVAVAASDAFQACQTQFDEGILFAKSNWTGNYGVALPWEKVGSETDENQQASTLFTYSGANETMKNFYGQAVADRSSRNRSMQIAIDSLRTKKETLADKSQQIERLIDSSLNARNQTASFLLSLITQLKTMLSAITK